MDLFYLNDIKKLSKNFIPEELEKLKNWKDYLDDNEYW